MSVKFLQFIGKGQITIPQEWRAFFNVRVLKATLKDGKIFLEPLPDGEEETWDVEAISLNQISKADRTLIQEGRRAYKKGDKQKFIRALDFFKH